MSQATLTTRPIAPLSPRAAEVAIRLEGLTKRFPVRRRWREAVRHPFSQSDVAVVREVSWEIRAGEFFGLLGPNGAGKTTIFKMLATLVTPDAGRATVAGLDVVRDAAGVRRVLAPVVADERSLYWRLSARENLRLFAALYDVPGSRVRSRVDELLHLVGLDGADHKLAGAFSSGMRQRLLIARALLARPTVLLLDEPTRSLDPLSARSFRAFLREEIAGRQGCTVLLATHNAEEAFELCERVAVLDRGRLLALGRADDLARRYVPDRYRLWTRDPAHPAFAALARHGVSPQIDRSGDDAPGWSRVELELPGGPEGASAALDELVRSGVRIARFEAVGLSLADLLQAILGKQDGATAGAARDA